MRDRVTDPVTLVGNTLAVLVAAQSLAERGRQVTVVSPAPGWGGHFASLEVGEYWFDAGMILYEFSAFNTEPAPDVLTYDADVRNDCGRFTSVVREFVERRITTVPTPVPQMMFRGRVYPDLIIGNRLDALRSMAPSDQRQIQRDLHAAGARRDPAFHASRKTAGPEFERADFASVSVANHGRAFHDWFLEPLCRKILGVSTADILARYHRVGWLPLYYPETLLSQFGPDPERLPATQFHYPAAGTAGALARALAAEVERHPNVRLLRSAMTEVRARPPFVLRLKDGSSIDAMELVWGLDASTLIALVAPAMPPPHYSRGSIGLCFIAIPSDRVQVEISTLFVIDPDCAVYRVTDQDGCAGSGATVRRLVVEFDAREIERRGLRDPAAQQEAVVSELAERGVIDSPTSVLYCSMRSMKNVLMVPNRGNRDLFDDQRAWVARQCPDVRLVGPAAGFFAASMNDQIVQGLKVGAALGGGRA